MSDTFHHGQPHHKHHVQGRGNTYGLCPCGHCRDAKSNGAHKAVIDRLKKQWRHAWKNNKEFRRGYYPA